MTWDVTDEALARTCFGQFPDTVGYRLIPLAKNALRARAVDVTVGNAGRIAEGIVDTMRVAAQDIEGQCGIEIGDVDFTGGTMTYRAPLQ